MCTGIVYLPGRDITHFEIKLTFWSSRFFSHEQKVKTKI